ncbi:MAG TPA: carbon storage regulator [Pirellulales bacterium]|nr:carbon storage regulator [Pirellulales bacterium]
MLVLSRRAGERIQIGEQIEVTVVRISAGVVRIGVEAPVEMTVVREEIREGFIPTTRERPVEQHD